MTTTIIFFILGFLLLIFGAIYLIKAADLLGRKLGVSSIVIGMIVVGFGTSLPELIISVMAVLKGSTDISISNAVGSNIANILIVLGILSLITSVGAKKHTIYIKVPFVILSSLILFFVSNDVLIFGKEQNTITFIDGLIFLIIFCGFIYYSLFILKENDETKDKSISQSIYLILAMLIFGLAGVIVGGDWVVDNAIEIAQMMNVSEAFIGVSILAIGSSLPEIVSSVVAAVRGNSGIAIGNIIGSNIFNTFLILGVASIIKPLEISGEQQMNIIINIVVSVLFFLFLLGGKHGKISKIQGVILLIFYVVFIAYSYFG